MQTDTLASPFPAGPIAGVRKINPDTDMTLDLFITDQAEVCIIHDRPFTIELSWLEYNSKNSQVDFVLDDGQIRNFGIPVLQEFRAYFHNAHVVNLVYFNPVTKKAESGVELPLIVQAA